MRVENDKMRVLLYSHSGDLIRTWEDVDDVRHWPYGAMELLRNPDNGKAISWCNPATRIAMVTGQVVIEPAKET
jgi:hypothetical protein